MPDAVVSFGYEGAWGHVRAAGVLRQVGFQNTASPDGEPSNQKTGYGLNLSGTWKPFGRDRLNWQVVGGKAIASYMNDGGIDLAPNANLQAETVKSIGWLAYYNHAWSDKWSSAIGASQHRQTNTDGQFGTAAIDMTRQVSLPELADMHEHLPRLWARARVDALLREMDRHGERGRPSDRDQSGEL